MAFGAILEILVAMCVVVSLPIPITATVGTMSSVPMQPTTDQEAMVSHTINSTNLHILPERAFVQTAESASVLRFLCWLCYITVCEIRNVTVVEFKHADHILFRTGVCF